MRGIAILMVILVHTSQTVPGISKLSAVISEYCQMGVQLFFVVSAFTLCHSWFGRSDENKKILYYAIRRFFRIAPIFYIGIVLYFFFSIFENYFKFKIITPDKQYTSFHLLANFLFIHGFVPSANNNIVPGGWSIGTEMAFYVIFPVLILLFTKIKKFTAHFSIMILFAIIAVIQIVIALLWISGICISLDTFLYYNLIVQLPVFILGMIYFFLNRNNAWPFKSTIVNASGLVLFTIIASCLWVVKQPYLFSIIPIVSGISFLFLIKLFEMNDILNVSFIGRLGIASYSMYLFHFIFAHKAARLISMKLVNIIGGDLSLIILFIMSVSLTFLVAVISERYIESYFINTGKKIIIRIKQIA